MVGVIDVGGGNRGVYGAGVFERCLDDGLMFDYCVGVSAGSANIVTYLAAQKGRLYSFYHDYAFRKEYMSFNNFIKTGEFIGLDYIYSTLTNAGGENPLNINAIKESDINFDITATDALSGKAKYFGREDLPENNYYALKASCAIPLVCKGVSAGGRLYYDGGIADPVPLDRAFNAGCGKVVLILTRPVDYRKQPGADAKAAKLLKRKYPALSALLESRAHRYNEGVEKALKLSQEGKCLIIAPSDCCGVGTLKKTPEGIDALYRQGYENARKISSFLKGEKQ